MAGKLPYFCMKLLMSVFVFPIYIRADYMFFFFILQHKLVAEDAVSSFSAGVDIHDCQLYIFTPFTVSHSVE